MTVYDLIRELVKSDPDTPVKVVKDGVDQPIESTVETGGEFVIQVEA